MKISNESKVGALTAISITVLILGFNFLKGKTLFKTGNYIFAKYADTKGLMVSNPVYVNGFQVGSVIDIENTDFNLHSILVTIKLNEDYKIPANSVASIKDNPLGTPSIVIKLGNNTNFLKPQDTIATRSSIGLFDEAMNKLEPVTDQIKVTVQSLDSVLKNINRIFDPNTKNNLQEAIANINTTTASLIVSAASIEQMLDKQSGAISSSVNNINSVTKNLADHNKEVAATLSNLEKTTNKLASADISGTIGNLKSAIDNLNVLVKKAASDEGSLGKLINDKTLYNNLNNSLKSANILIDDLRVHPKRYVQFSVFGKKEKSGPLLAPIVDTASSNKQ
jgi:phospholipid/cholesterol/gamma-HCH transport system substrate-binding protein